VKLCLVPYAISLSASLGFAAVAMGCAPSFYDGPLPGAPANATYANVGGAHVRYVDVGEGPAVVLIHGFAASLDTWATVIPALSKKHRVIAPDLKGFGFSSRPEGDYSPSAQAKLVTALMDSRGIENATVVAHSWGSSVALALSLASPARVTRLALYDAWVYEEQLPTFFLWSRTPVVGEALFSLFYGGRADERIEGAFYDKEKWVTERLVEDVERALDRPGTTAAALAATRGQRFAEVSEKYKTIKQPTLLLWGREDQVTTLGQGERLARDLPHAKLVVYPRCGHFPMLEASSASTADLTAFIDDVATAPAAAPAPSPTPAPAPAPEKP
jgi:pimeloyl-ACP methyl ester carboxylesterase